MRRAATVVAALAFTLAACTDSKRPSAADANVDPFATSSSTASETPSTPPAVLAPGDCFDADGFAPGTVIARTGIRVVDCAEPHQHQVYAVLRLPEPIDTAYPGTNKVKAFADDNCLAAFKSATGSEYRTSLLDFATINPDESAWNSGERAVVCAVHHSDFQLLTGTQVSSTTTTTTSTSSLPPESG